MIGLADGQHRVRLARQRARGHYTVVTCYPCGIGNGSREDTSRNVMPEQQADDVHRLLSALGGEPAYVFAAAAEPIRPMSPTVNLRSSTSRYGRQLDCQHDCLNCVPDWHLRGEAAGCVRRMMTCPPARARQGPRLHAGITGTLRRPREPVSTRSPGAGRTQRRHRTFGPGMPGTGQATMIAPIQ